MGYFTLKQLENIQVVISHGNNCPDGIASAMIVVDAYGTSRPEIRVIDHGSEEKANLEPVPGMMFVDFSPPVEKAQAFIDAGTIVLDHHAKGSSVQDFVKAGLGVFGDEVKDPGVCGAVLAYEHVWKPLKGWGHGILDIEPLLVREFARLSGIRDTWQTQDPDWIEACEMAEALRFWPLESLLTTPNFWRSKLDLGALLWTKKNQTVAKIAEKTYRWASPKGTRVGIFQGVKYSSDVAEKLGSDIDLLVAYDILYENEALKLICSTRSRGDYDCGALSLAHGGGGHTRAAGFSLPMTLESPNPYRIIQDMLTRHEGRS